MLIFCDESDYEQYRVIGSVWLPRDSFFKFEKEVLELRDSTGFWEEVKSLNLNAACLPERIDFYEKFLKLALSLEGIQIALIRFSTDMRLTRRFFPGGRDQRDFSFLKLLIVKKTPYFMSGSDGDLSVLHDYSQMSNLGRKLRVADTFKKIVISLTGKNLRWSRPADSKICSTLQLADLITGLVRYRLEYKTDPIPNVYKAGLIDLVEKKLNRKLYLPSYSASETPYNLFLHTPRLIKLIQAGIPS